jgi:hypothetical protein
MVYNASSAYGIGVPWVFLFATSGGKNGTAEYVFGADYSRRQDEVCQLPHVHLRLPGQDV